MAFQTIINNGEDYQAADITTAFEGLVDTAGVADKAGGSFAVTQKGTPDASVDVAAGLAFVPNSSYSLGSGNTRYWPVRSTAVANVAIPANASGNPRVDRICIKVDTGATPGVRGSASSSVLVVTGTAAASPTASATPSNHLSLATVAVANGFSSIVTANITDGRTNVSIPAPVITQLNNVFLQAKTTGGTVVDMIGVTVTNSLIIGSTSLVGVTQFKNPTNNDFQYKAKVFNTGTQTIADVSFSTVLFPSEVYDTGGLHSTSVNTSRLTIPANGAGKYSVKSSVAMANGAGNRRILRYKINGTAKSDFQTVAVPVVGSSSQFSGSADYLLAGGDYIELEVWQNSGGNLAISEATFAITKDI